MKKFSWTKAMIVVFVMGAIASYVSIILQTQREVFVQGSLAAEPSSVVATAAAAGLGSSFNAPGLPVQLSIPAIGLSANIQQVGMSWSGVNIGVPTNFTDVGWFKYGPRPGVPGTAIIDGHLDGKYVPRAVFFNLQDLRVGDMVNVTDSSGTVLQFQVTATKLYDYTASTTDIFAGSTSTADLDLITCAGDWVANKDEYTQRIVVFTELVSSR